MLLRRRTEFSASDLTSGDTVTFLCSDANFSQMVGFTSWMNMVSEAGILVRRFWAMG